MTSPTFQFFFDFSYSFLHSFISIIYKHFIKLVYQKYKMDFVKEGKLEQEQARKQAEWERVRKAEDPIGWFIDS